MKRFFSPLSLWQSNALALIRIVVGGFIIYHGCEMFDTAAMNEYFRWDMFKDSSLAKFSVYGGKVAELLSGILFVLGLLTRIACIIVICTLGYIAFFVGNGKIWYEDQYPFLFVVIGVIYIFTGPGSFSLDNVIFKNKNA